jgi:hypothetical protein
LEGVDATGAHRTPPDAVWWLSRPLAVIGPLLCTLPVIYLFGRRRNH